MNKATFRGIVGTLAAEGLTVGEIFKADQRWQANVTSTETVGLLGITVTIVGRVDVDLKDVVSVYATMTAGALATSESRGVKTVEADVQRGLFAIRWTWNEATASWDKIIRRSY